MRRACVSAVRTAQCRHNPTAVPVRGAWSALFAPTGPAGTAVSTRRLALTRSADWFLSRDWCGDGFCLSFQGYGRGVWSVIRQRMLVQSGGDDKVKER